jgi:hypothetical protein
MEKFILQQDLYESDELFQFRLDVFTLFIEEYKQILYSEVNVIVQCFINKLLYNEIYDKNIEDMIKLVNWNKLLQPLSKI